MKKYLLILFALSILSSLLVLPSVKAFGVNGHEYIGKSLFEMPNPPQIIKDCMPYEDSFLAGEISPDIMVIYYYSNGGTNYKLTHNWNFVSELFSKATTPDQVCFAYGFSAHLIQDSISHNQAVPSAIRRTLIPNDFVHPLLEKKFDSEVVAEHPEIVNITKHCLDIMFTPKGQKYIDMMQSIVGDNHADISVKDLVAGLATAVGGGNFFNTYYTPKGSQSIFSAYHYVDGFTNFLQPYLGSLNTGIMNDYFNKARELTIDSMNNWGQRLQISPHGFDALAEADRSAVLFNWIYIFIMIIPSVILIFFTRKWYWLFLIPIMFIIEMIILYAIV